LNIVVERMPPKSACHLTLPELKKKLKVVSLPTGGTREQLVARYDEYLGLTPEETAAQERELAQATDKVDQASPDAGAEDQAKEKEGKAKEKSSEKASLTAEEKAKHKEEKAKRKEERAKLRQEKEEKKMRKAKKQKTEDGAVKDGDDDADEGKEDFLDFDEDDLFKQLKDDEEKAEMDKKLPEEKAEAASDANAAVASDANADADAGITFDEDEFDLLLQGSEAAGGAWAAPAMPAAEVRQGYGEAASSAAQDESSGFWGDEDAGNWWGDAVASPAVSVSSAGGDWWSPAADDWWSGGSAYSPAASPAFSPTSPAAGFSPAGSAAPGSVSSTAASPAGAAPSDVPRGPKTQLCLFFQKLGTCKHGLNCKFAHGEQELGNDVAGPAAAAPAADEPRPPKRRLCKFFEEHGTCKHGANCTFAHGEQELERGPREDDGWGSKKDWRSSWYEDDDDKNKKQERLCSAYERAGFCKRGDECYSIHGEWNMPGAKDKMREEADTEAKEAQEKQEEYEPWSMHTDMNALVQSIAVTAAFGDGDPQLNSLVSLLNAVDPDAVEMLFLPKTLEGITESQVHYLTQRLRSSIEKPLRSVKTRRQLMLGRRDPEAKQEVEGLANTFHFIETTWTQTDMDVESRRVPPRVWDEANLWMKHLPSFDYDQLKEFGHKGMKLVINVSAVGTHIKRLGEIEWWWPKLYYDKYRRLAPCTFAFLWQFPPDFRCKNRENEALVKTMEYLKSEASLCPNARHIAEFHDRSWYTPETYDLLQQNQWCLAWLQINSAGVTEDKEKHWIGNLPDGWTDRVPTTDFVYVRLCGGAGMYRGKYTREYLQNSLWESLAVGLPTYVMFGNDMTPEGERFGPEKKHCMEDAAYFKQYAALRDARDRACRQRRHGSCPRFLETEERVLLNYFMQRYSASARRRVTMNTQVHLVPEQKYLSERRVDHKLEGRSVTFAEMCTAHNELDLIPHKQPADCYFNAYWGTLRPETVHKNAKSARLYEWLIPRGDGKNRAVMVDTEATRIEEDMWSALRQLTGLEDFNLGQEGIKKAADEAKAVEEWEGKEDAEANAVKILQPWERYLIATSMVRWSDKARKLGLQVAAGGLEAVTKEGLARFKNAVGKDPILLSASDMKLEQDIWLRFTDLNNCCAMLPAFEDTKEVREKWLNDQRKKAEGEMVKREREEKFARAAAEREKNKQAKLQVPVERAATTKVISTACVGEWVSKKEVRKHFQFCTRCQKSFPNDLAFKVCPECGDNFEPRKAPPPDSLQKALVVKQEEATLILEHPSKINEKPDILYLSCESEVEVYPMTWMATKSPHKLAKEKVLLYLEMTAPNSKRLLIRYGQDKSTRTFFRAGSEDGLEAVKREEHEGTKRPGEEDDLLLGPVKKPKKEEGTGGVKGEYKPGELDTEIDLDLAANADEYAEKYRKLMKAEAAASKVYNPWIRVPNPHAGMGMVYYNTDTAQYTFMVPPVLQMEWESRKNEDNQVMYIHRETGYVQNEPPPVLYQGYESEDSINLTMQEAEAKVKQRIDELTVAFENGSITDLKEVESLHENLRLARMIQQGRP